MAGCLFFLYPLLVNLEIRTALKPANPANRVRSADSFDSRRMEGILAWAVQRAAERVSSEKGHP
jgi:hypothetical protein